jgi:hypothetical protein
VATQKGQLSLEEVPMPVRALALPLLLALLACERYYPLGTANDASVPPSNAPGTGGSTTSTGGSMGAGSSGDPGGKGGQAGSDLVGSGGSGGSVGSGGSPAIAACSPATSMPERPLAISPEQVAQRLARYLWNGPADPQLVSQAASLKTNLEVRRLAQAMFSDPRFAVGVDEIVRGWLGLQDATLFEGAEEIRGEISDGLRPMMVIETGTFMRDLFVAGDGRLATVLLAPYSFINDRLAALYGVPGAGPGFQRVELPKEQRSGILTHASFLFMKPHASQRGSWLINKLLCSAVPPPPADFPSDPAESRPGETARQALERSTAQPACAACHRLVDPPGFAFEHYDALGRWRGQDNGQPVNATGIVENTMPAPLKFDGARQLGEQLLNSCDVQRCVSLGILARALLTLKPLEPILDTATEDEVLGAFVASGLNLRELLAAIVSSRPFLAP